MIPFPHALLVLLDALLVLLAILTAGLLPANVGADADPCARYRAAVPRLADAPPDPAVRHAKGLLWKVERPGTAPSHIFGTIHLDDPRVTNVPSTVLRPLAEAKNYLGEVVLDPRSTAYYTQSMYFGGQRNLRHVLDEALFAETIRQLVEHGIPRGAAERLKPWAAFTILGRPRPRGGQTLDVLLQDTADLQRIPIHGLETIEELVATLDGIPMSDQIAILKDTVCNRSLIDAETAELTARYLDRDLAAMLAISRRYDPDDQAQYEAFMKRLLTDRNKRMLERMEPYLAAGGAFIAVGALHLPGDDGLLELLEARGYRVSPVY